MSFRRLAPLGVLVLLLAGCSGDSEPTPDSSAAPVDTTVQALIEGEWTLTRTVTESDDAANPLNAVGAVSTRAVLFGDVTCSNGPCEGGVLSGLDATTRDSTTFTSSGNTIRYSFTGFVNCLRQDTGAVLVTNGYAYTADVELTVATTDPADEKLAATLEGTLTYTDELTPEAIEAGCAREPASTTTVSALSAVRAAPAAPAA